MTRNTVLFRFAPLSPTMGYSNVRGSWPRCVNRSLAWISTERVKDRDTQAPKIFIWCILTLKGLPLCRTASFPRSGVPQP